jgi:hypothetical protein
MFEICIFYRNRILHLSGAETFATASSTHHAHLSTNTNTHARGMEQQQEQQQSGEGFVARIADNERQATYEHTDLTMSPLTGTLFIS